MALCHRCSNQSGCDQIKAVILAAGVGRRLLPITRETPKALLVLEGRSLLSYQLENLEKYINLSEIYIVVGHCSKSIEDQAPNCNIIKNYTYRCTNSIFSLWLTRNVIDDELIIITSDLLFHPLILDKLMNSGCENAIVVAPCERDDHEAMKVNFKEKKLVKIGKNIVPENSNNEFIGLAKFSKSGSKILFDLIDHDIKKGRINKWFASTLNEFVKHKDIDIICSSGLPCIEIDTILDYKNAEIAIKEINSSRVRLHES